MSDASELLDADSRTCIVVGMTTPDILVIDDLRTFAFPAIYARTSREGLALLEERPWRELWLDYALGHGADIKPVVRVLEEWAALGRPLKVGLICVHTSDPVQGEAMVAGLGRWYQVRRMVAHSFLART
jgi:hypothetical protein